MDYAFKFVIENGGLDTEKDYPYTPVEHRCDSQRENRHVVTIDGYRDVPPGNETALMEAVRHGPVSIAIEADQQGFQFYSEGVFDGACGDNLDHGVLIAGYGRDEATGQSYWLVKNSWGAGWGDHGYIKLAMGIGPSGQCGITSMASYPIKNHPNPPRPPPTPPSPAPAPHAVRRLQHVPGGQHLLLRPGPVGPLPVLGVLPSRGCCVLQGPPDLLRRRDGLRS